MTMIFHLRIGAPSQQQQAAPPPPPLHTESSEPLLDVFDGHSSGSAPPSMPSSHHSSTADLFNTAPTVPAAPTSGGSLLDMDGPHYNHGNQNSSSVHHDFMGMTAPVAPSQPPSGYGQQQQQQQQRPPQQQQPQRNSTNVFDSFGASQGANNQGPFGDLNWG